MFLGLCIFYMEIWGCEKGYMVCFHERTRAKNKELALIRYILHIKNQLYGYKQD